MLESIIHFFTVGTDCVLAIPPLILAALIGAGTGLVSNREKQAEADRQRQYESETARWSPWTGMKSKYVQNPNMAGDVAGGAAAGLSFGSMNNGMFGGANSPTAVHTQEQENPFASEGIKGFGPVARGSSYNWAYNNYNK